MNLTKLQIKERLLTISCIQQIQEPDEESLDAAFLDLVYNAHKKKYIEITIGENNPNLHPVDIWHYTTGEHDGTIETSRKVLKNLFGINLKLLKQFLS